MPYHLIDSGSGQKLERFGSYSLIRPSAQAVWRPLNPKKWEQADAVFQRETGARWKMHSSIPERWSIEIEGVCFRISLTEFGHLGIFPEHAHIWKEVRSLAQPESNILNLFAYSGGVTLAAAQAGANVCHLDASKGMVDWARENAALNGLTKAPIRWIVDDAKRFLKRELKRGVRYDGIILDPPTFGRGSRGEVFQIEKDLYSLLEVCRELLSKNPHFVILSCHSAGMTAVVLEQLLSQIFGKKGISGGDLALSSPNVFCIPSGCYAKKIYR